jgi:hypothetical protein
VGSDAVWFKPSSQHDGSDLQDLVVDVLKNFIPTQGFDIHTDVQVPPHLHWHVRIWLGRNPMLPSQGRSSRSKIAPGSTHDHVGFSRCKSYNRTSTIFKLLVRGET